MGERKTNDYPPSWPLVLGTAPPGYAEVDDSEADAGVDVGDEEAPAQPAVPPSGGDDDVVGYGLPPGYE